jgi:hypothetical protein
LFVAWVCLGETKRGSRPVDHGDTSPDCIGMRLQTG